MALPSDNSRIIEERIRTCRKLADLLAAGSITFDEYADNVTISIVASPDDGIAPCVATVPSGIAAAYADYLRTELEPVDFMPCPKSFLAGDVAEEVFERRKRELRPKYVRLYQLMTENGSAPMS